MRAVLAATPGRSGKKKGGGVGESPTSFIGRGGEERGRRVKYVIERVLSPGEHED